ncbi:MAG: flagellin [Candidatus Handelsmanbacteria bacterium]|nr:flagellin [Candidatus Handelsmanbacteria bacterium]
MPLRINNNIAAINTRRRLNANNRDLNLRLERLSSGLRVNRAADDAAGLSVREGMRAEISGLKMNILNAEQASNLLQVAEGSLNEINAMMIRLRELAVQSSSSTLNDQNRESIQAEYVQILMEIDRVSLSTTYNDQVLLTGFGNNIDRASTALTASGTSGVANLKISGATAGTYTFEDSAGDGIITLGNGVVTQTINVQQILDTNLTVVSQTSVVANFDRLGITVTLAGDGATNSTGSYTDGDLHGQTILINAGTGGSFQVGPDDGINNRIEATIPDMRASGTFINLHNTSVGQINTSRSALSQIDQAITNVSNVRGDLGAVMNRLAFTVSFTENEIENLQNSESSISDADIANEVAMMTRAQILSQAATAMLAQANAVPQTALQLLQ